MDIHRDTKNSMSEERALLLNFFSIPATFVNCFTILCLWRGAPRSHHGLEGRRFSAPPSHLPPFDHPLLTTYPSILFREGGAQQRSFTDRSSQSNFRLTIFLEIQGPSPVSSHRMVPPCCPLVMGLANFVFLLARKCQPLQLL